MEKAPFRPQRGQTCGPRIFRLDVRRPHKAKSHAAPLESPSPSAHVPLALPGGRLADNTIPQGRLMPTRDRIRMAVQAESAPGVLLALAALAAILCRNGALEPLYDGLLAFPIAVSAGAFSIAKPLLLWINDALMAVFFLLVAIEIKRELVEGELARFDRAALPLIAAAGGVAAPALIFVVINRGDAEALRGWAIPSATDIAFAVGVLALLGKRVPTSLKTFLLAVAIVDDLAAILIIAAFYAGDLSLAPLALAGLGLAVLALLNAAGVRRIGPYLLVGLATWVCVLKSGVHPTLAGVATGMAIPLRSAGAGSTALAARLEHGLRPWVSFAILPLFAFANAGVSLEGLRVEALLAPVPLGIALGLFFGKQLGVFAFAAAAVVAGVASRPAGASLAQLYGVSCVCGVGFTMSLFIGGLAYAEPSAQESVRLGVIAGSLASGLLGALILTLAPRAREKAA